MGYVLGISAFYHDSAAALLKNGEIISASQEERFTRIKNDSSFPINSIKNILSENNITLNDLRAVVFYEKPFLTFERLIETYLAFAPKGFFSFFKAIPLWLKKKIFQKNLIFNSLRDIDQNFLKKNIIKFSEHHLSHAASAFYSSPYQEAIILTLDGVGEWATSTISIGKKNKINTIKEIHFPHSLGLLYSSFTQYLGFKVNSGEYKLMGLAPYGKPIFSDIIKKKLVDIKSDGTFRLNLKYFDYPTGLKMINKNFELLFKHISRDLNDEKIEQFHMDVAASIQKVTEEIVLKIVKNIKQEYKFDNLCLAGGVALNCVANGKILKDNIFKSVWVQPASGDAGGSLGAAQAYWFNELNNDRIVDSNKDFMKGSYLGPEYSNSEVKFFFEKMNIPYKEYKEDKLYDFIAEELAQKKIVGWFQGRMEFGPRALGNRSILADPRDVNMQKKLNLKIKFREGFRPFAPAVLSNFASEFFKLNCESPYMSFVTEIADSKKIALSENDKNTIGFNQLNIKRSLFPSITHVDLSARVQTVHKETNSRFYNLIKIFYEKTSSPILINTSFNVRGEPIVCTVEDAYKCFMNTDMDILVCGDCVLVKKDNKNNINSIFFKKD